MATMNAIGINTGASNTMLQGAGVGTAPTFSTATYPATTTINQLLYSSAANAVAGLATANSGVLITSSGGVPSIGTTLPIGVQTNITELGTVTVGVWNASLIPLAYGGTNANLVASNGGIFYSTGTAGAILSGTVTANQVLLSGSSTTPAWSTATYPATTTINQLLYSSAANTIAGLATANSAHLVTTSTGVPVYTATMTNGQVVIGSTGATPTAATLTAGTGVTITNGAGSITIASSGTPQSIVDQNSSSVTMAVNTIYIIDNGASLVTLTLNATVALGQTFEIVGFSAGGWTIAQNAGQTIHFNSTSTTTGATGTLSSTVQYNSVKLTCSKANTDFTVTTSQGNLTVV
jgi:hypothetical protein